MIAVSGRRHSCGVRAILQPTPRSSAPVAEIERSAEFVFLEAANVPIEAQLEPVGQHADAKQCLGIGVLVRAAGVIGIGVYV